MLELQSRKKREAKTSDLMSILLEVNCKGNEKDYYQERGLKEKN